MAGQYWFARTIRRKDGYDRYGHGLLVLTWQGRAVVAFFVLCMVVGGVTFIAIALTTQRFLLAVPTFIVLALVGAGTFLWAAATKSDPDKSRLEYLAQRDSSGAGR